LPEILEKDSTKQDFFNLPRELITLIISSSKTLISEFSLFKVIEERLISSKASEAIEESTSEPHSHQSAIEVEFMKCLLQYIRLPLINPKSLVTDIKFSGFFEDNRIFEAMQFKLAKEALNQFEILH